LGILHTLKDPFHITPYDNAKPGSKEDAFNFHLSSCRIYVECAFGEMYKRRGFLWRPLTFKLVNNIRIIECIFHVHNYVIQFELDNIIRIFDRLDEHFMSQEMLDQMQVNISSFVGYFGEDKVIELKRSRDLNINKKVKNLRP